MHIALCYVANNTQKYIDLDKRFDEDEDQQKEKSSIKHIQQHTTLPKTW